MASSKWSGHDFGMLSHTIALQLSSPISGAHRHASMYSRILLVVLPKPSLARLQPGLGTWADNMALAHGPGLITIAQG